MTRSIKTKNWHFQTTYFVKILNNYKENAISYVLKTQFSHWDWQSMITTIVVLLHIGRNTMNKEKSKDLDIWLNKDSNNMQNQLKNTLKVKTWTKFLMKKWNKKYKNGVGT